MGAATVEGQGEKERPPGADNGIQGRVAQTEPGGDPVLPNTRCNRLWINQLHQFWLMVGFQIQFEHGLISAVLCVFAIRLNKYEKR